MTDTPAEHKRDVCGQFDTYLKKIEHALHMAATARDGEIKIIGPERTIGQAKNVFNNLIEPSKRGNTVTEQNVGYVLSLSFVENDGQTLGTDKDIICWTVSDKPVKLKTLRQKHYVDTIRKKMIVFDIGPAGTGEMHLAVAMATQTLENGEVGRIILIRPAIEAGKKLGFLLGDLQSKIDPYLRSLCDALYQVMGAESYLHNLEKGPIEVAPPAYMKGRTPDSAYITLDGAQNTAPTQMEMLLIRIGFGSKVIIAGDQTQKDLLGGEISGLDMVFKVLKRIGDIGLCYLTGSNVACHPLVQKIAQAYGTYEQKNTPPAGRRRMRERD